MLKIFSVSGCDDIEELEKHISINKAILNFLDTLSKMTYLEFELNSVPETYHNTWKSSKKEHSELSLLFDLSEEFEKFFKNIREYSYKSGTPYYLDFSPISRNKVYDDFSCSIFAHKGGKLDSDKLKILSDEFKQYGFTIENTEERTHVNYLYTVIEFRSDKILKIR